MHQDVTHFERSHAYPELMVEYGADTWDEEEPKNNFTQLQNLHISAQLEEKLLTGRLRPPGKCHHKEDQMEEEKGGQRTASCANASVRVSRKRGGNNRQERKDAVSGREDANRGADNTLAKQQDRTKRRSSTFGGKPQCVVEQHESCGSYCLANVAALPTAHVEVTRTRWHGQQAIVIATEKVHPGGKRGKGRDCHAEQLVKNCWQWYHTST